MLVHLLLIYVWYFLTFPGDLPKKCTGACAAVVGNHMIMFGGFAQGEGHNNQLCCLDLATFVWKDLSNEVKGTRPSLRDKFGCWVGRNRVIYFGGFGHPPDNINKVKGEFCYEELPNTYSTGFGWNNHLFVLKFGEQLKWKQPICTGARPCPRAAFATAQIRNMCYLFGGRFKDERKNDLYRLDAETFRWEQLKPTGMLPCGRSWQVLEAVSDQHLFVYGGFDNDGSALKDTWIYDISKNMWCELPSVSNHLEFIAPRMWHTSCSTDSPGEVLIFGGCVNSVIGEEHTIHTNTVAIFRFSPLSLQRLSLDYIMQNIGRHSNTIENLPRTLQRRIHHRSQALGLSPLNGHGKLINNCQIM